MIHDNTVKLAADLIRRFEGLSRKPYRCPAGIPTIGYGSTRYADGRAVSLKDPMVTEAQADELLMLTLCRDVLPGLLRLSPALEGKPRALAALGSFVYNLGLEKYRTSTLRRRVDAGDWAGARQQLARWVYANGQQLPGLVKRREAESRLLE